MRVGDVGVHGLLVYLVFYLAVRCLVFVVAWVGDGADLFALYVFVLVYYFLVAV